MGEIKSISHRTLGGHDNAVMAAVDGERLTGVNTGVGGGDAELWLNEFGDEGDEGCDNGALGRVGQTDEQEGHVAEDPQCCLGEVWGGAHN